MTDNSSPITVLPLSDCWDLLAGVSLGRLVTSVDGNPAIFPVNFAVQNRTILFRTAQGTKLVSTAINNNVLFEADDHDDKQGWSVIVAGTARSLRDEDEIAEAQRSGLLPWTTTDKPHFIQIRPRNVTGRRFAFGPATAQALAAEDPVLG